MSAFVKDIWPQVAAEFGYIPGTEPPTQVTRNGLDFGDVALIADNLKKTPLQRLLDAETFLHDLEILGDGRPLAFCPRSAETSS